MGAGRIADEWLLYTYRVMELGWAAPDPINHVVGLLRSGLSLSDRSTIADLVAGEVAYSSSYARVIQGRLTTALDATADTLTIPGHGLAADAPVVYAAATAAAGLSEATTYFVRNPTTDTIQLGLTAGGAAINFTGTGTNPQIIKIAPVFDAGSDMRAEAETDQCRISATGGDAFFQGYFILANGGTSPSTLVSSIATPVITTPAAHGLPTGQEVLLMPDPGGTQPGGTSGTTIYFVRALSTFTLQLHPTSADATNNTNAVAITSSGSGTIRLRNARGVLKGWEYFGSSQSLTSGSNYLQQFRHRIANNSNPTGV